MIKLEKTEVVGLKHAIRGMRNPMNSWDQSDSQQANVEWGDSITQFSIGKKDLNLMERLKNAGPDHRKFMRMIAVYVDITAPLYWWKEFDTYKVGTVANSCSTMHKIAEKMFVVDDFSTDHLIRNWNADNCEAIVDVRNPLNNDEVMCFTPFEILRATINALNVSREAYLTTKDKKYWWQMIQLLPSSYNQKRTVMLNYEVLRNMYHNRKNHKLDEWHGLCDWIDDLPYSELITNKEKMTDNEALSCFAEISKLIKNGSLIGPETNKRMEEAYKILIDRIGYR